MFVLYSQDNMCNHFSQNYASGEVCIAQLFRPVHIEVGAWLPQLVIENIPKESRGDDPRASLCKISLFADTHGK